MTKIVVHYFLIFALVFSYISLWAQNVGLNILTPVGKLHIKGSQDIPQLIIDANGTQSNTSPFIKLRKSDGTDLMWIHTDNVSNLFLGLNTGRVSNGAGGSVNNTIVGSNAGYFNTTGYDNTAVGTSSLNKNISGHDNTSSGVSSLSYNTIGNYNIAYGSNALNLNTAASENTALGYFALASQSYNPGFAWSCGNVAIGYEALYSNQPTSTINGINNTAIGHSALHANTIASDNTATGCNALLSSTGSSNTANGSKALFSNLGGYQNTAMGKSSLYSNTTGYLNTAMGIDALYYNTQGYQNTATGSWALYDNILGQYNTAMGVEALLSNTNASQNTAIGVKALAAQSYDPGFAWASGNVAVGYEALYYNQPTSTANGISNTAVGIAAMRTNTTGWDNTGIGSSALYSNTVGFQNTATGRQALFNNTSGFDNVAMGYKALRQNTIGSANVAYGDHSLYSITDGIQNCAVGFAALYSNTEDSNTACGMNSLYYIVGGSNNTAIGYGSGTASGTPNIINTVSLGNNGYLNGASNQAFLGNLSTNWCGGNTTWFTYASDERVKKNVNEDVQGLDFISRLRPVTYNLDITAMRIITGNAETADYPEKYDVEKIKQSGFIAQEVEQAALQSGYSFSGITIPRNEHELYTMSYSQFVVPLVKAVQELNEELTNQVATLNSEITRLNLENETLSLRLQKIETLLGATDNKQ